MADPPSPRYYVQGEPNPQYYIHGEGKNLQHGAGAVIFHLASQRVVLCRHPAKDHWGLPQDSRYLFEDECTGAERNGYERSGYRCRVLPLPVDHRKKHPPSPSFTTPEYVKEPILFQLKPRSDYEYQVLWYVAETLSQEDEMGIALDAQINMNEVPRPFVRPPHWPEGLTLPERMMVDGGNSSISPTTYEPVKHQNTRIDGAEQCYESNLFGLEQAYEILGPTVEAQIVYLSVQAIYRRMRKEVEA